MGAYRIYSTSGGPTKGWEQTARREEILGLPRDHLSMARRRPLSLHHLVSRFPAEAAPMSTDLLRWLRYFSEDMLPFNQKLSTILVVKLHFSAVADFFIFCQHFLLLFFNILVLM